MGIINKYIDYQANVKGLAARTTGEYEKELRAWARWAQPLGLRWSTTKKQDIDKHVAEMTTAGLKPATIKKRVAALRSIYKWMQHEGLIQVSPAQWCQTPRLHYEMRSTVDVKNMLAYLDRPAKSNSARLLHMAIAVMLETGVRVSELLSIRYKDIDQATHTMIVRGKGGSERIVVYGSRTEAEISKRNYEQNDLIMEGITDGALRWAMIHEIDENGHRISPHQLRHTYATFQLNNGMNLKTLSTLLGHKSVKTTEIYAKMAIETMATEYNQI